MKRFLLKTLASLVVLGLLALAGFSEFGDLSPARQEVSQPVTLHVD